MCKSFLLAALIYFVDPCWLVASEGAAVRIVILGDSTVADYPANLTVRGWGQAIGAGFKDSVVIRNLAQSGRSTKTFIKEGRLKLALAEKPDFALIQFGHNDSHGKGRPESTDSETDYREFLRDYIDAFRKIGAQPILVTPMHRRLFKNGKLTEELKPYADAMKAVAQEKRVAVVDLYTSSGQLLEKLGEEASGELFCSPTDRTHFSEKGAKAMAGLVLEGLKEADKRLAGEMK